MFKKLDQFHKSRLGYLLFGMVELVAAYVFISVAIDRGGLGWYLLALIFLVGALQNFIKLIGALAHGRR